MAELHTYEVVVNGIRTTLRLSDGDAKKRNLTKNAPAPQKKSRTTADK